MVQWSMFADSWRRSCGWWIEYGLWRLLGETRKYHLKIKENNVKVRKWCKWFKATNRCASNKVEAKCTAFFMNGSSSVGSVLGKSRERIIAGYLDVYRAGPGKPTTSWCIHEPDTVQGSPCSSAQHPMQYSWWEQLSSTGWVGTRVAQVYLTADI